MQYKAVKLRNAGITYEGQNEHYKRNVVTVYIKQTEFSSCRHYRRYFVEVNYLCMGGKGLSPDL